MAAFEQTVSRAVPNLLRKASLKSKLKDGGEAKPAATAPGAPQATPRWRGLGFNQILAAAIRANEPPSVHHERHKSRTSVHHEAGFNSSQVESLEPAFDDDEQKEELHRLQRKRDMLKRKVIAAEEKCRGATKENNGLRNRVTSLQEEAHNIGGERFSAEVKANETGNRLHEFRVSCEALKQQEAMDRRAFTEATNLKNMALYRLDNPKERPPSGGRKVRPASGGKHVRLQRPISSPAIMSPDPEHEPVGPTCAPSKHVDALLAGNRRVSQRVRTAAAFHKASCSLQAALADADVTRSRQAEEKRKLQASAEEKAADIRHMCRDIEHANVDMQQISAEREARSEKISAMHETVFGLEKDCEKQESLCEQTAAALERHKEFTICDAESMRQPIEDAEKEVSRMKAQLKESTKESSRCSLEARHHNEWRLWSAASFRRQKEDTEGKQRRLRSANANVGRQIEHIRKEHIVYTTNHFDVSFGFQK